jgi:hypothetical protein
MAATNKYDSALAAFIAAKAQLYKPATTWPEYREAVSECDEAWQNLVVAANREFARPNQEAA